MWTPEGFIAVDWGTTNRRAYRLDAAGVCLDEFEDGKGILSVEPSGFPAAVSEIRGRLGDLPLLMAGMVGSNRGWIEAPYVPCPAGIDDLAAALAWAEPERTAIVPGVSYLSDSRADVMRGEEVQLLGAIAAGDISPDCTVCHPGTHNKWVEVKGGRIERFVTVMTGEMFSLLKDKSILSDLLRHPVAPTDAFIDGVRTAAAGRALTADLFAARAGVLLGRLNEADAASFVSGLLIGADIRTGIEGASGEVVVMGRPELTELYVHALSAMDRPARAFDGEQAFIAGILAIAKGIS